METPRGKDRKPLVCFYEFLGQIFFMYAVLVSGGSHSDSWGIAGPLALFAVASIFGGVSGGHFNPAVTLGVYIREKNYAENFLFMVMIIASQISGALVGMMLAYLVLRVAKDGEYTVLPGNVPLLLPSEFMIPDGTTGVKPIDSGSVTLDEAFTTTYMEVICTFIFVLTILHVTGKHTSGGDTGAWTLPVICLVLWALCSVDNYTGASFNPALATGSTVFQAWWYPNDPSNILTHYLPMYAGGAALGGILAGFFYQSYESLFVSDERQNTLVNESGNDFNSRSPKMH